MATDAELILQWNLGPGDRVAVIGAGGTTRLLSRLALEWAGAGGRPWIATTTRLDRRELDREVGILGLPGNPAAWDSLVAAHPLRGRAGEAMAVGVADGEGGRLAHRLGALPESGAEDLAAAWGADLLLWKADGSKGQPFKAHAAHEPEIPSHARLVIAVVGLWVLGRPLVEAEVHRAELACDRWGYAPGEPVDADLVFRALTETDGYRQKISASAGYAVYLHHRGEDALRRAGDELASRLRRAGVQALAGDLGRRDG